MLPPPPFFKIFYGILENFLPNFLSPVSGAWQPGPPPCHNKDMTDDLLERQKLCVKELLAHSTAHLEHEQQQLKIQRSRVMAAEALVVAQVANFLVEDIINALRQADTGNEIAGIEVEAQGPTYTEKSIVRVSVEHRNLETYSEETNERLYKSLLSVMPNADCFYLAVHG